MSDHPHEHPHHHDQSVFVSPRGQDGPGWGCGGKGCGETCCVDCNTGWIQATLREENLNFRATEATAAANFRAEEATAAANFRTSETNACNNAQGAIRDLNLAKSMLAEITGRGFTASALADSTTQQLVGRDTATIRLEQSQAELRMANIAAANAAVAAAAACKTDSLVMNTAFQTQKELAAAACEIKAQIEKCCCELRLELQKCCCELKESVTFQGVATRTDINQQFERLIERKLSHALANCERSTAAYFAAKVPPVVPTCGGC